MVDVFHGPQPLAPVGALPIEVLAEIMQYLAPAGRRRAASVSRHFRRAAHVAGFSIHYRLRWYLGQPIEGALAELTSLLSRISRDNLRISVDFACCPAGGYHSGIWEDSIDVFLEILPIIVAAMPYITLLSVTIPALYREALDEALLCRPAPHLHHLSLTQFRAGYNRDESTHPIPTDVFAGGQPTLCDLSLYSFALPADPLAAFARVHTLRIVCDDRRHPVELSRHFPSLKSLHAEFICRGPLLSVTWAKRTFASLCLDELTVENANTSHCVPAIQDVLDVAAIPVVRLHGSSLSWDDSLWDAPLGALCARLRAARSAGLEISISPEHKTWRRVFVIDHSFISEGALTRCATVRDGLTYIRVEWSLMEDFLRGASGLPALRQLRIDVGSSGQPVATAFSNLWDIDPDVSQAPQDNAPCPALDALTIFALDGPVEICSAEIALFGQALGQAARRKDERARLVLVPVAFSSGSARASIDQAFSFVQLRPFSGRDSVEDRQCPMWHV